MSNVRNALGRLCRSSSRSLPLVAGLAAVTVAGCGGGGPERDAQGWLVLFNGKDLSGWHVVGDGNWRIEDGAITADQSSAPSYVVSDASYADFDLELEFWVNAEANSGVFLRCSDPASIADTTCYEANIFDTRPDQTYRTGSIVNVAAPAEFVYTGGQWNRYEISAVGNRLQVKLNGRNLVDVEDSRLGAGPIALQHGTGIVRFRNVRLRER